ncbi:MAG: substrate-binding domain-containing protein, partial [Spirochaetaceae bacterium]|nr:substrate-binding domain-containing protein [Spirochaetaceae bacterium]
LMVMCVIVFSGIGKIGALVLIIMTNLIWLYLLYQTILKKIWNLQTFFSSFQGGDTDLSKRLPVETLNEIGDFSSRFNIFMSQLHEIVFELKNVAGFSEKIGQNLTKNITEIENEFKQIREETSGLSFNNQELNQAIEKTQNATNIITTSVNFIANKINDQSSAVEESSAAVEELISSILNINNVSSSKLETVNNLVELVRNGEKNMEDTVESILRISNTVDIIQEFIEVINGVASQTNLLAMNAAIEAAHAGEAGKGFGVVADEIRKLAETTTENAKNIGQNISTIITNIDSAVDYTKKTDISMKDMTLGIDEVSKSMREIIDSMKEMSAGSEEMTQALAELVTITGDVKESSGKIIDESLIINSTMKSVSELSRKTNQATIDIDNSTRTVEKSISVSNNLGTDNFNYIEIMKKNISRFTIIDISNLRSVDNQLLIQWDAKQKEIPQRPANPSSYDKDDEKFWFDYEYAGWNIEKTNIPDPPADGIEDKNILLLESCDHPYHLAYRRGAQKIADAYGVNLTWLNAMYSTETQSKQVKEAIHKKPDLVIVTPTSAVESTKWFRKLNEAGIPTIGSNTTPEDEGFRYILGWTGPDDWSQFRLLARDFAKRMNYQGDYAVLRHIKGNSNYISRTHSIVTELKKIAPEMKCVEMESAVEYDQMKKITASWLRKHGDSLKGFVSSEPGDGVKGMCEAVEESGRTDIVLVSAGNSLATQDLVKADRLHSITYQSAEADGALSMKMAVDWFNGIQIPPARYLPGQLITKDNVDQFYPTQW